MHWFSFLHTFLTRGVSVACSTHIICQYSHLSHISNRKSQVRIYSVFLTCVPHFYIAQCNHFKHSLLPLRFRAVYHSVHNLPVGGKDEQSCLCLIVLVLMSLHGAGFHKEWPDAATLCCHIASLTCCFVLCFPRHIHRRRFVDVFHTIIFNQLTLLTHTDLRLPLTGPFWLAGLHNNKNFHILWTCCLCNYVFSFENHMCLHMKFSGKVIGLIGSVRVYIHALVSTSTIVLDTRCIINLSLQLLPVVTWHTQNNTQILK